MQVTHPILLQSLYGTRLFLPLTCATGSLRVDAILSSQIVRPPAVQSTGRNPQLDNLTQRERQE
jgi:hypothetical protein